MRPTASRPARHLLLGRDHERYGDVTVIPVSPATACAISAGVDPEFARTTQKEHVNEDALLVREDERHTVMCVADAHFGRQASERLIARVDALLDPVPENPERLAALLSALAEERTDDDYGSETTLVVCILDRLFRQAFGLSYGDSSVVRAPAGEVPRRENRPSAGFVTLARPRSLAPEDAEPFAFSPAAGDLLLVFTDGIDECCYRDPDRSVTPEAMGALLQRTGHDPELVARELGELALRGVDGHPGGQDNLALAVTRV